MSAEAAPSTDESVGRRWLLQIRRTERGVVASQSASLAASVAVGTLLVGGAVHGLAALGSVIAGLVCGVLLAVSVATIRDNHILASVVGGLGVLVSGSLLGGFVASTVLGVGVFGLPAVVVGFGVACFWVAGFGNGALGRAIGLLVRVGVIGAVTAVAVAVVWIDLLAISEGIFPGLTELFVPTTETGIVAGFVVVCWLAVGGLWIAVATLPPAAAVPRSLRTQYQSITQGLVSTAAVTIGVGGIVVGLVSFVSLQTTVGTWLLEPTVGWLVESSALRTGFVRLWLAGMVAAVVIVCVRAVGGAAVVGATEWSSSGIVIASGLFGIAVLAAGPLAEALASTAQTPPALGVAIDAVGPTAVGLVVGLVGIAAVGVPLFAGVLLAGSGVVPASTAGPRLAAGGLVWLAAVAATAGSSSLVVVAAVVAAVVVWDIALFGVGVSADLDSLCGHRDGQYVHSVATLAVGGLSAVGAGGVYWLVVTVRVDDTGAVLAVVIATLILVVGSLLLRRR